MSLGRYGWSPFFEAQLPGPARSVPGRVRLATARRAQVYAANRVVNVSVPRNVGPAAVGDWLLFNPKRTNGCSRPPAAQCDCTQPPRTYCETADSGVEH